MKKQILTLIIGILIGAIITTGVFLILKGNTSGGNDKMNMRENMRTMDGNMTDEDFSETRENMKGNNGNSSSSDSDSTDSSET